MRGSRAGCTTSSARTAGFEGENEAQFDQLGVNLNLLPPGIPMAMYHEEPGQEDFLVLYGECLLIVEGEERPLAPVGLRPLPAQNETRNRGRGHRARPRARRRGTQRPGELSVRRGGGPARRRGRAGDGLAGGGVRAVIASRGRACARTLALHRIPLRAADRVRAGKRRVTAAASSSCCRGPGWTPSASRATRSGAPPKARRRSTG